MLTAVCLWASAVGTVWGGCYYAATAVDTGPTAQHFVDLNMQAALLFPITASLSLLLLFYYFWFVQYILLILLTVSAFVAVADVAKWVLERLRAPSRLANVATVCAATYTVWQWIVWSDWMAMDVIGISLAVSFIASVRFPSLRVATLCLSLLFIYDLYWVYFSSYAFSKNVMVEVAKKQAASPVAQAANFMGVESNVARTVELPIKLLMPNGTNGSFSMLGLGDIVLPGVLCNLAYRADFALLAVDEKQQQDLLETTGAGDSCGEDNLAPAPPLPPPLPSSGLFACSLVGYGLGLAAAFWVSIFFHHPQPALIFIVPSVLLSLSGRAAFEGRLSELWQGSAPKLGRIE